MGRWTKTSTRTTSAWQWLRRCFAGAQPVARLRRPDRGFFRLLSLEPLESRQLLSVAVLDQSAVVDQLLTPEQMDALAVQEASADLARLRPSPHVGYQQHEAADSVGRVQSAKLSAYVAPPLPTLPRDAAPFVAMFPGLEKYFQAYRAGLDQLHRDIQGNPDARPTIWGNATVDGGGDYRLNLDDNGMVIASWTIDWGDGSQPEKVGDPPWVMHHYADHSAHYTITATASSGEDAEFSEFSAGKGGSRGGGLDTNFTGIHKPTQALDDIYAPSVDATPISDALATDDSSAVTFADADTATLDGGQMMTMDAGGELDPNFGKIVTNFNSNSGFDEGRAVAMQDSSILVAGGTGAGDFGLAKYLDDGSLDTDFDTDGLVTTHFTAGSAIANAVAVNGDEIVAAGVVNTGGGTGEVALAQYDPYSGECYWSITDSLSSGWDEAKAVLILSDDSIIVAGSSDGQFVLLHYGSDGVRDTSFGGATDGIVVADFGGTGADATALALDSQGRILVAGSAYYEGGLSDFALARYNADGTADTTFGDGGITTADFWGNYDQASAIAVEPEGGIILAGYTDSGSNKDLALARFTVDGWLDPSFHGDARVSIDFDGGNDQASGVVVQADGRIIAAGWAYTGGADHFALVRYNSDGSLDADTFGTDGKVVTDFSDLGFDSENAHGIALDANGNYVVAGTAHQTEYSSFALARYTPGTEGITVEVVNVPPTVNVVGWQQATAGLELSLPGMASFSHPGSETGETFTYQIDWGDGNVDSGTLPDLTGDPLIIASIDGSHTYADGGMFYVAVTVTDADGGSDTQTILVTVNDDPPGADPDPGLLAAAREALGLPAGANVLTADWARLTSLTADSNKVLSLEGLQSATNLVSLTLVPSDFSDPGHLTSLAQLKNLNKLQSLTLERCGLSGSELTSTVLSTLTSLTTLDLRYNNISVPPSDVASPPSLSTLYVYGNPLTDTPQAGLANLAGKPINVDLPADHPEKATTIADLAARLYKLPVKMYEYVLNTIEYQPYLGAMKGPLAVLQTGAGNDWDTDALLAALFQAAGGITTTYVSGQIQVPIQQAEDYVGATDPYSAQAILNKAGQNATRVANNGQVVGMKFDHTWLQAQIGSTTYSLDPSWKFRDFRPGIPNLFSQVPFNQTAYLAAAQEQQKQSAAEFYEEQVRGYLATHYPDKTLADVAHDGPIHPQAITSLSTSLPYTVLGVYRTDSAIPDSKKYQVEVTLYNGGTQLFDWKNTSSFLSDISLQRLTIDPNRSVNGSYTTVRPRLWLDGAQQASYDTGITWLTTDPVPSLSLTVNVFTPDPGVKFTTNYARPADRYMAIGLDANQMSEQLLVNLRQTVNAQQINEKNGSGVDRVAEIGGMLALAMATYFHDTDEGEDSIAGLTGAVADGTVVAVGLATSGPDIVSPPAGDDLNKVQMPYQPKGMGIDVPGGWWGGTAIDGDYSHDTARASLMGYHDSAVEGLLWEELSNYDGISTMKAFQRANQSQYSFTTLDSTNVASRTSLDTLLPLDSDLSADARTHIRDHVWDFIDTKDYQIYVPTHSVTVGNGSHPNPNGPWIGVGYTLTVPASAEVVGFIIDDGINTPHGGGAYGDFSTPVVPLTSGITYYGLDPINTANGDVAHDETDLTIPNLGTPLTMARHYHSFDTADSGIALASDRGMGDGWSFSYSDRLVTDSSQGTTDKVWITDNGVQLRFKPDGGNWKTPATIFGNLTHPGSDWLWTDKAGTQVKFNSDGYLTEIRDRYDNGVSIHYQGTSSDIAYVADLQDDNRRLTFIYNSDPTHHITSIQDFTGRTWLYQYNAAHRLASVTSPSTFGTPLTMTQYGYFPETDTARKGLLQTITDPDGNVTQFAYYANRRGMSITDAELNTSSATYNIFRKQTAQINANGLATDYTYDDKGDLTQVRSPDHATVTATWNTDKGLKLSSTDAFGQTTTYHYDTNGNLLSTADPLENVVQNSYTTTYSNLAKATRIGRPDPLQDSYSSSSEISLSGSTNSSVNLGSYVASANTVIAFDFTSSIQGQDVSVKLIANGVTVQSFQVYGSNTTGGEVQDFHDYGPTAPGLKHYVIPMASYWPVGTFNSPWSLQFSQTSSGSPAAQSVFKNVHVYNASPLSTTYEYSGDDKSLTKVTDALNDKTTYTYPNGTFEHPGVNRGLPDSIMMPQGNLQQKLNGDHGPYGYTTDFDYNAAGQMTSRVSPVVTHDPTNLPPSGPDLSTTERWDFDTQGNLTQSTDGLGAYLGDPAHTTFYTYDLLGHRISQTQPDPDGTGSLVQPVTTFVYDAASNLLSSSLATSFPQRTTSSTYDKMQRATKAVSTDTTYTTMQYDPAANVTDTTDAMGRDTQYVYDSQNRPVATIRPDHTVVSTTYNGGGEIVATTDANGNTSQYTYDAISRKTGEIAPYDNASKAMTLDQDTPGWTLVSNSGGYNNNYTYTTTTSDTTTWAFTVTSGTRYEVLATWVPDSLNTTAARYQVYDGSTSGTLKGTVSVSQKGSPPLNATFADTGWLSLGRFYISNTTTLTVKLSNLDSGHLVADAVRIIEVAQTSYAYDPQGNLQYLVDALGRDTSDTSHTTEYRYDKVGHKTAVISPDPDDGGALLRPVTLYTYDANGNVQSVIDARGASDDTLDAYGNSTNDISGNNAVHKTEYAYDEKGRQIQEKLPDPDGGGSLGNLYTWLYYDNNDNLQYVVDPKGANDNRPQSFSASDDYTTQYVYDALNGKTIEKQPDPDGSGGSQTRPTTGYAYDNNGNLASVTDPNNNVTRFVYDLKNRQTKVTDALGAYAGDPAHTTTATFDAVGNAILVTDALGRITVTGYDALNRKVSQTLPRPDSTASSAPRTSWYYDDNGNLYAMIDPRGYNSYILYDAWNRPVVTIDPLSHTTITAYDPLSRVTEVTDQLGRTTQYVYDNLGRKTQQTVPDPDDYSSSNGSNGTGTSPVTYYGYDLNGNLKWVTDPRGSAADDWNYTTYYFYDMLNRPVGVIDPKSTATQSWTPSTVPDTITLSPQPNKSMVTTYDGLGDVATTSDQLGHTTTYHYDNLGRKTEQVDPQVACVVSGYPNPQNITPKTAYGYDANGNLLYVTDPLGASDVGGSGPGDANHTTWTTYDALNRPIRSVSALGKRPDDTHYATVTTYDAVGNVTAITDPAGSTTRYTFDRLDRKVEERDPLGHSSFFQFDLAGNMVQKLDPENRLTQYVYDPLNRQTQEKWLDANGSVFHTILTSFDAAGQMVGVSETDVTTALHTATPVARTDYQYIYDRDGRVIRERMTPRDLSQPAATQVNGSVTNPAAYVLADSPTGVRTGDIIHVSIVGTGFDPSLKIVRPNSNYVLVNDGGAAYTVDLTADDPLHDPGTWEIWVGSADGQSTGSFTLQWQINPALPLALAQFVYTYYADGSVASVSNSAGGLTEYQYDSLGRMTQEKQTGTGVASKLVDFVYNDNGTTQTITRYAAATEDNNYKVVTSTYLYDDMGRTTSLAHVFDSTNSSYTYQYDAASRMVYMESGDGITDLRTGGYDANNQVKAVDYDYGYPYQTDEAYSYDTNGNRVNADWKTGAANRLLTSPISGVVYTYTYDKEGNRTARFRDNNHNGALDSGDTDLTLYGYDYRNRLTALVFATGYGGTLIKSMEYSYDYADRRIARIFDSDGDGNTDEYRYNVSQGTDAVMEVYDQDGLGGGTYSASVSHRYLYGPAVDEILADEKITTPGQAGTVRFGLGDDNGTIRDVLQLTSPGNWTWDWRQYDSFGKVSNWSGYIADYAFGLNGMPLDVDGYLYATDTVPYDPLTARRLSEDWIGYASGTSNFYVWAGNDPWNQIDPSGMDSYGGSAYTNIHTTFQDLYPQYSNLDFSGVNFYNVTAGSLPGYSVPSTSNLSSLGFSTLGGSVVVPSLSTFTSAFSTATVGYSTVGASNIVAPSTYSLPFTTPMPSGAVSANSGTFTSAFSSGTSTTTAPALSLKASSMPPILPSRGYWSEDEQQARRQVQGALQALVDSPEAKAEASRIGDAYVATVSDMKTSNPIHLWQNDYRAGWMCYQWQTHTANALEPMIQGTPYTDPSKYFRIYRVGQVKQNGSTYTLEHNWVAITVAPKANSLFGSVPANKNTVYLDPWMGNGTPAVYRFTGSGFEGNHPIPNFIGNNPQGDDRFHPTGMGGVYRPQGGTPFPKAFEGWSWP